MDINNLKHILTNDINSIKHIHTNDMKFLIMDFKNIKQLYMIFYTNKLKKINNKSIKLLMSDKDIESSKLLKINNDIENLDTDYHTVSYMLSRKQKKYMFMLFHKNKKIDLNKKKLDSING